MQITQGVHFDKLNLESVDVASNSLPRVPTADNRCQDGKHRVIGAFPHSVVPLPSETSKGRRRGRKVAVLGRRTSTPRAPQIAAEAPFRLFVFGNSRPEGDARTFDVRPKEAILYL
uniref:Uncharacterized protein n=1 Tax=Steinernema glaseri TaxID=37863 RepID=A0A1I7ZSJ7_9BILA